MSMLLQHTPAMAARKNRAGGGGGGGRGWVEVGGGENGLTTGEGGEC